MVLLACLTAGLVVEFSGRTKPPVQDSVSTALSASACTNCRLTAGSEAAPTAAAAQSRRTLSNEIHDGVFGEFELWAQTYSDAPTIEEKAALEKSASPWRCSAALLWRKR